MELEDDQVILFGHLVVRNKLATQEQVDECMEIQRHLEEQGSLEKLGDIMVSKGHLTQNQLHLILRSQQRISRSTGQRIPGYEIISKLGQGSMGSVYQAKQISMDRSVSIKVLSQQYSRNKNYVNSFLQEARAAAQLSHPNIVRAIDVGNVRDLYYFVMEYVDGKTVHERLRKGGEIPEREALKIAAHTSRALQHAHASGIIHRDVKPDNLLVSSDGEVKLCDLGLAKASAKKGSSTEHGTPIGTPHYMSPEQARGRGDLDARTDIYSLGATLYHMVTGHVPYEGSSATVVIVKLLTEDLISPEEKNSDVSPFTSAVIQKMMFKDPEGRHMNMEQVEEDLMYILDGQPPIHTDINAPGATTFSDDSEPRDSTSMRESDISAINLSRVSKHDKTKQPDEGKPIATLTFLSGVERGRKYSVIQPATIIGRMPDCDVQVADTWFSRKHFVLYAREGQYEIEDLHSMNGTRLNGRAVTRAELQFGDQIGVFDTLMRFDPPNVD